MLGACTSPRGDRLDVVRELRAGGADANAGRSPPMNVADGRYVHAPPLVEASAHGYLEVVRLLLAHGADTALLAGDGRDALAYARQVGNSAVADALSAAARALPHA